MNTCKRLRVVADRLTRRRVGGPCPADVESLTVIGPKRYGSNRP